MAIGQEDAGEDSVLVSQSRLNDIIQFEELKYYDLDFFQNYRTFRGNSPVARSGNLGLPLHYFDSIFSVTGIEAISGAYLPYLTRRENIKLYDTNKPFTSLSYVTGAEKEQQFSVLHTQNFGQRMNISFQYDRITSEGFFAQQLTNHTKFTGNIRYTSFNKRFESIAYYAISSLEAQENGGVFIDSVNNPDDNTVLLDVNLRSSQNQVKYRAIGFINEYAIFKNIDSSNHSRIFLGHELEFNKTSRGYSDIISNNGSFFDNNFLDTIQTNDSISARELSNSFYVSLFDKSLKVGAKSSSFEYFQNFLVEEDISSEYSFISYSNNYKDYLIEVLGEKGLSGYHKSEYDISASFQFFGLKRFVLNGGILANSKRPNPLMETTRLNHIFYNENLDNIETAQLSVGVSDSITKTNLQVSFNQYNNWLYYNEESRAVNYDNSISVLRVRLTNKTEIFKNLFVYNNLTFQSANVDSIIPIPNFLTYSSLYYQSDFFEHLLRCQIGVDFYYISEFNRLRYNPSLAQFNREQNNQLAGSNTQLDVFLNVRIKKSAKVFLKMENILQAQFSEDSYRIQDYPIPGRALKVGIYWRMLN